jgi:hypothetical protein
MMSSAVMFTGDCHVGGRGTSPRGSGWGRPDLFGQAGGQWASAQEQPGLQAGLAEMSACAARTPDARDYGAGTSNRVSMVHTVW